jgi:DNA-binding transcriptional regulator YiaG
MQRCGDDHPQAKLTEAAVARIRASRRTHKELAAEFGVAVATIAAAREGASWAHVRGEAVPRELPNGAKLTAAAVAAMRMSPLPHQHFAQLYKTSENNIRAARQGRTWRSVEVQQVPIDPAPKDRRLTEDEIAAIRASTESTNVLARHHRITKSTVRRWRRVGS